MPSGALEHFRSIWIVCYNLALNMTVLFHHFCCIVNYLFILVKTSRGKERVKQTWQHRQWWQYSCVPIYFSFIFQMHQKQATHSRGERHRGGSRQKHAKAESSAPWNRARLAAKKQSLFENHSWRRQCLYLK